jgi:hypothetical protein
MPGVTSHRWPLQGVEQIGRRPSFEPGSDKVQYADYFNVEDGSEPFARSVFRDPANANDVYVHTFHSPIVVSQVYRVVTAGCRSSARSRST